MATPVIKTADMLKQMGTGKTFSMLVCSYNRQKRTGGKRIEYPEAILTSTDPLFQKKEKSNIAKRPPTEQERKKAALLNARKSNPHHRKNYTRNITLLVDGHITSEIRTIHPPLVLKFNNQIVVP